MLDEALKYPSNVVKPSVAVSSNVTAGVISKGEGDGVGGGEAEAGGRFAVPIADDPPPHPNSGPVVTHRPKAINNSRRVAVDSHPVINPEATAFGV